MKNNVFRRAREEQSALLMRRAKRWPASTSPRLAVGAEEAGIALLLSLLIIFILSGLAVSIILLTDSQIRLERTVEAQSRVHYAALAGLEEARGRLNPSAPDTITPLPTRLPRAASDRIRPAAATGASSWVR